MKRFFRPKYLLLAAVVLIVVLLFARGCGGDGEAVEPYETATVRVGDLVSTVSATGTLDAVGTVTVGTQVSGELARVFVDFNDRVEQGDLLAVVDTELLDASVRDAQAGVDRALAGQRQAEASVAQAEAQRAEATAALARNEPLVEQGYLSAREFAPIQTAAETAAASVRSAQAGVRSAEASVASAREALRQAQKNRQNAEIRAPISGVVIQRNVDAGQTVAASFSTPELFVIAEDLGDMEILVQVDESDVGLVEAGQPVEFTVAAYPDRTFRGVTREVRLRPQTVQNVVLYTVVVAADNESGLLLPGMTATVDFIVGGVEDALLAPAAAIRFDPPEEIRAAAREAQREAEAAVRTTSDTGPADAPTFASDLAEVWTPTGDGDGPPLRPILVRVLATDGTTTAIAPREASDSDVVRAGLEVVTRVNDTESGSGVRVE